MPEDIWPTLARNKQSNTGVDNHLETLSGQMKQLHEWPTHYHLYHIIFLFAYHIYIYIYVQSWIVPVPKHPSSVTGWKLWNLPLQITWSLHSNIARHVTVFACTHFSAKVNTQTILNQACDTLTVISPPSNWEDKEEEVHHRLNHPGGKFSHHPSLNLLPTLIILIYR